MLIILTSFIALLFAGPCPAQEDVFTDDFDAGNAVGWTAVSGGSDWRVRDGRYVFDGGGWGRQRTLSPVAIVGGAPWPVTDVVRGYKIPEEILRSLKDTWDEIGRINAELQAIGPWVANSDVSPGIARVVGDTPAQAVALVSGMDTVIVIALNLSINTDWTGKDPVGIKSYDPVDATVRLDLPEWIDPTDVFSVDHEGLTDLSPTRDGRSLVFELPGLAVQEVIVVTENVEVRTRMAAINAEMRDRLQAMATHVPTPAKNVQ